MELHFYVAKCSILEAEKWLEKSKMVVCWEVLSSLSKTHCVDVGRKLLRKMALIALILHCFYLAFNTFIICKRIAYVNLLLIVFIRLFGSIELVACALCHLVVFYDFAARSSSPYNSHISWSVWGRLVLQIMIFNAHWVRFLTIFGGKNSILKPPWLW